jgi:uncharacterized protein (TIGR02996 family)
MERLLHRIHQHPDDDDARQVYADWLLQQGDPRGELIALQLAPSPSRESRRRAEALLAAHGKRWLGALAPLVWWSGERGVVWERGFPVELRTAPWSLPEELVRAARGAPEWATVRRLESRGWKQFETLVLGPSGPIRQLANLRELEVDSPALVFMDGGDWPLTHFGSDRPLDGDERQVLFSSETLLPQLRSLALGPWDADRSVEPYRPLWDGPVGRRIRVLAITRASDAGTWRREVAERAPWLERLELRSLALPWWRLVLSGPGLTTVEAVMGKLPTSNVGWAPQPGELEGLLAGFGPGELTALHVRRGSRPRKHELVAFEQLRTQHPGALAWTLTP